jgi:hypothetical protein
MRRLKSGHFVVVIDARDRATKGAREKPRDGASSWAVGGPLSSGKNICSAAWRFMLSWRSLGHPGKSNVRQSCPVRPKAAGPLRVGERRVENS